MPHVHQHAALAGQHTQNTNTHTHTMRKDAETTRREGGGDDIDQEDKDRGNTLRIQAKYQLTNIHCAEAHRDDRSRGARTTQIMG